MKRRELTEAEQKKVNDAYWQSYNEEFQQSKWQQGIGLLEDLKMCWHLLNSEHNNTPKISSEDPMVFLEFAREFRLQIRLKRDKIHEAAQQVASNKSWELERSIRNPDADQLESSQVL